MNLLGDLAYRKVFSSRQIYKMELAEYTILDFLMNRLVSSVLYYNTDSEQDSLDSRMVSFISDNYKTAYRLQSQGKSRTEKLYHDSERIPDPSDRSGDRHTVESLYAGWQKTTVGLSENRG